MDNDSQLIFRFAPSPNGELHLGHAYSALLNLKMARDVGGKMLLRIEDIDTVRCTPELEKQMLEDLEWIGFEWDEEPIRQSERFDAYRQILDGLAKDGLIYPATLSRGDIKKRVVELGDEWPSDPDGAPHYPGNERDLSEQQRQKIINSGEPYTLRLDMTKAIQASSKDMFWNEDGSEIPTNPSQWGDVVLARKDTPASYHLSCVLDDAFQGITHIVRGQDLYHATSVHRLLQNLLDLQQPQYHHHDLILDDDSKKLSKSNKDTSLRQLRKSDHTPSDIIELISFPNSNA